MKPSTPRTLLRLGLGVGFLLLAVVIALAFDLPTLAQLRQWSTSMGNTFVLAFWLGYILITQFPIPRTFLTLSSGILFGPLLGIVLALSATTISAGLSLISMRFFVGNWVRSHLHHPMYELVNTRIEQRGWLAVISLRMIAAVPFSILNYAASLTPIRVAPFMLATLIGSSPGSIATVFLGDTLTGEASPVIMIATIILTSLGLLGLWIDTRWKRTPTGLR